MEVSIFIPQFLKVYSNIVLFAGQHVVTKAHTHHAVEIIISFDADVILTSDERQFEGKGLLIKADIAHSLKAQGFVIVIYISPETTLGKRLKYILEDNNVLAIQETSLELIKNYISKFVREEHEENDLTTYLTNVLVRDITQIENNYPPDLRISNVVVHINKNLHKSLDFKVLKEIACLSESRLIHLFKRDIGIPIRKYVLWCRLQRAVKFFLKGRSWTQAANLSGFSDVAHLTRTFVSMFGVTPSQILKAFT